MLYNLLILSLGFILNLNNINIIQPKNNINTCILKFEEEDFDIDNDFFNKTLPYIKNIEYNKKNDMWIIDLDTYNESSKTEESYNKENYEFPSFYKFLESRKSKKDQKNNKSNNEIESTSKDLQILTPLIAIEWAKTWIYEMVHVPDFYPTFMYQDMFKIREFAHVNTSKEYFYIGYFPIDTNLRKGPYYVGVFELIPSKKEFRTYLLMQNPYHYTDTMYDDSKMKNFKKELLALCKDSNVKFKFDDLKDAIDKRYYYSWLFED